MSCNWMRMEEDKRWGAEMSHAVREEKWDRVTELAEQRPVLLFWEGLEFNRRHSILLEIWRRNEAIGRKCVRIVLKDPELAKRVAVPNMGQICFHQTGTGWVVEGALLSFLAGCGERELMKEALETGLNVDGWGTECWYEEEHGLYQLPHSSNSFLRSFCIPSRRNPVVPPGMHGIGNYAPGVTTKETTPLLIAILRADKDMVKLLIDHGASFDPEAPLCRWYLDQCGSQAVLTLLKEAYGGC